MGQVAETNGSRATVQGNTATVTHEGSAGSVDIWRDVALLGEFTITVEPHTEEAEGTYTLRGAFRTREG